MDAISLIFGMCANGNCLAALLLLATSAAILLAAHGGFWWLHVVSDGLAKAFSLAVAWVMPGQPVGYCLLEDDLRLNAGVALGRFARGPPDRRLAGGSELTASVSARALCAAAPPPGYETPNTQTRAR